MYPHLLLKHTAIYCYTKIKIVDSEDPSPPRLNLCFKLTHSSFNLSALHHLIAIVFMPIVPKRDLVNCSAVKLTLRKMVRTAALIHGAV